MTSFGDLHACYLMVHCLLQSQWLLKNDIDRNSLIRKGLIYYISTIVSDRRWKNDKPKSFRNLEGLVLGLIGDTYRNTSKGKAAS